MGPWGFFGLKVFSEGGLSKGGIGVGGGKERCFVTSWASFALSQVAQKVVHGGCCRGSESGLERASEEWMTDLKRVHLLVRLEVGWCFCLFTFVRFFDVFEGGSCFQVNAMGLLCNASH